MDYLNKKNSLRDLSDADFELKVSEIAKCLEENGFIYDSSTSEELQKDWNTLCKKKTEKASGEEDALQNIVIPATCTSGMKAIRKYMPHFYSVKNYKGVSVLSLWKRDNLEKALRFNRKYHSTPYVSEIIRSLSFTNGLGKITIYRPVMAKTVVEYFQAKTVLDVCVGWGGRMLGTVSAGSNYFGIEPFSETYQGLCKIRDEFSIQSKVELVNDAAEKVLANMPVEKKFDLALTSPPYYNLEIYSDEPNQSLKYGTYEQWKEKFLEPVIVGVLSRVKYSCWSVKNFKTNKKYNLFEDVVKIHGDNGWKMLDITFSTKNSKRPGGSSETTSSSSSFAEETTFVFVEQI